MMIIIMVEISLANHLGNAFTPPLDLAFGNTRGWKLWHLLKRPFFIFYFSRLSSQVWLYICRY